MKALKSNWIVEVFIFGTKSERLLCSSNEKKTLLKIFVGTSTKEAKFNY